VIGGGGVSGAARCRVSERAATVFDRVRLALPVADLLAFAIA
jgi:hypothetical protein